MSMTVSELIVFVLIATLGHAMALFWYVADRRKWRMCEQVIYDLPISREQIGRELKNSLHTPMHALVLVAFFMCGFFNNAGWISFFYSALATTIWAEIWHYASHRAFHLRALHWIHVEHHRSRVNSPFTAISFSFLEKAIFDIGLLAPLAAIDAWLNFNVVGIGAWYIGYLLINSFSHANFELKTKDYNHGFGKVLTTTTYHSLHHSRYTGNYGLGTRVLDQLFKTEWTDYEQLYDQVCGEKKPLRKLSEKVVVLSP